MKLNVQRELPFDAAESKTPCMRGNSMRENRETHGVPPPEGDGGRSGKAMPKPDMLVPRESDVSIVPAKRANKTGTPVAERGSGGVRTPWRAWQADSPPFSNKNFRAGRLIAPFAMDQM